MVCWFGRLSSSVHVQALRKLVRSEDVDHEIFGEVWNGNGVVEDPVDLVIWEVVFLVQLARLEILCELWEQEACFVFEARLLVDDLWLITVRQAESLVTKIKRN